ncbi:MAG: class I SAM-dependent rRNA methyltransferase [Pseudomonadota bacterium]|nr:class I SAM-dependent rRNA methyltransferase [Pseudomonadota bacterium]MDE3038213.1 class I SAM-dependent rRNA methyltransferase [Pseudomonadota bacterium]
MAEAPPLRLKKGRDAAVFDGMPWVYASDIIESSELLHVPPGGLVTVENHKGQFIGIGYYNAKSQIACRMLTLKREPIDEALFQSRLETALARRKKLFGEPYYRLAHAESDSLPGLLIDRFGDAFVVQVGTAGMELLQPLWLAALQELFHPKTIILRNDIAARKLEGLRQGTAILPPPPAGGGGSIAELRENGFTYYADLLHGQKTGWFYDQRDNREMISALAKGKTLLDVYSHSGGFGLLAATRGAAEVTLADSSKPALELAKKAAAANGITCEYRQGDAFALMDRLQKEGKQFDIVLADPPAFVKSKKDVATGLKGYEKVARLAAFLVKPGGLLFVASCSHHAARSAFNKAVLVGVKKAGRHAEILRQTGASADHPKHPKLPQSEYLKGILLGIGGTMR